MNILLFLYTVGITFTLALTQSNQTQFRNDECEGIANGIFVRSTKGCAYFIFCNGPDTYEGICPDAMFFNQKDQVCDIPANVDCVDPIGGVEVGKAGPGESELTIEPEITEPQETTGEEEPTDETEATDESEITDESETPDQPETPDEPEVTEEENVINEDTTEIEEPVTEIITTTLKAITEKPKEIATTAGKKPLKKCPANENPKKLVFIPSNTSCSEYYLCYHGQPIPMTCAGNLHYNPNTEKCDFVKTVNCQIKTMPGSFPDCTDGVIEFFPHPDRCDYFLYCSFGQMTIQQCPFYYYWDVKKQSCRMRDVAECACTS